MAATRTGATKVAKNIDQATESLNQVTAASQEKMRETFDRSLAAMSEMGAMGKENVEAMMASATAASKGLEQMTQRAVAYSKTAMEHHLAATKAMMTSKSVQELLERQSEYARQAFDKYVEELNKMSDLMSDMTKGAVKPLNERMSAMSHLVQTGMRGGRGA